MIFNNSDKLFLVWNEDSLPIEKFAQIFKCEGKDVEDEYDELLRTREYLDYQRVKLQSLHLKRKT